MAPPNAAAQPPDAMRHLLSRPQRSTSQCPSLLHGVIEQTQLCSRCVSGPTERPPEFLALVALGRRARLRCAVGCVKLAPPTAHTIPYFDIFVVLAEAVLDVRQRDLDLGAILCSQVWEVQAEARKFTPLIPPQPAHHIQV